MTYKPCVTPVSKNVTPSRPSRTPHETTQTSGTRGVTRVTDEGAVTLSLSKLRERDTEDGRGRRAVWREREA